ncbi:hypothetical protein ASPSYDRAFT_38855 [Aspergillus sydowii CBS 593.65]|uniref:Uncharacterized protein n=1 Tax=Aspergillus sydowii CBS 593.65 TaxID=1036612 RepID=A0A1L9TXK6_9EURO|nr:uncharacterized protein ASPSYDRAFT_38855 [Aspergillus sydowii CBS 593.65]OJJ64167.1 hypothetical protein ASPSYDRAFT_38855 [Aspergillus sydowii CBS 593.65]
MDEHSIYPVTACWPSLLENTVIVLKPTETFPPGGGLLKLSFGALLQLTAVEYPVMIDSGLVLMGYSTALIPIEVYSSGIILWHLETSSGDQQLRQSELRATKGSWLKRQTLKELQTTEALLGWCASARIQLGTSSLDAASVRWSDATVKPTTWHWKGANLQLLAQSAAPIQTGAQIGLSWERVVNTARFTPGTNYTGCLASSMREHVVLYDVTARRAWLVPLLSVYHHMLFIYCGIMLPSNSSRPPIPTAGPSLNGTSSPFKTLQTSGGIVVEGANDDILTIRDLIVGFAINFSGVSVQAPRGSRIYGYELLDLVLGSPRSELKTATVKRDGLGWAPLLNELPCLFCAELGDAIVGMRGSEENSPCNYIPAGQDLLASPLETIKTLCQKQGSAMTSVSGQITQTHALVFQREQLFVQCSHDALAISSCWESPQEFVQKLYRGIRKDGDARLCSESLHPEMGAVVLGNVKPQGSFGFWR